MARTYYAEGRQLAFFVRGMCILAGLALYFYTPLRQIWWMFFVIIFGSVLVGEIVGARWTRKRREAKKGGSAKKAANATLTAASKQTAAGNQPVPRSSKRTDQELLTADVDTMTGTEFERLMEMYYKDQGYQVNRVGGSGDHEVDLILTDRKGMKIAVQCKRWKRDVGNDIVLRLKAGKQVHGCYDAWVVTTSHFTKAAKEAADRLNIRLINGLELHSKLSAWKKKWE